MKLLFDQNLSFKLCSRIADLFPGSSQVRLLDLSTADDIVIWEHAKANGFTLVSQDSDFADLSSVLGAPPKFIWLRFGNKPTTAIERALRLHADAIMAFEQDTTATCLEIY